jgi:hypothetical protein
MAEINVFEWWDRNRSSIPRPVLHLPIPGEPLSREPGLPPRAPFEGAGAEVLDLGWDNRPVKRTRFPMASPDINNPVLQRFRERFGFAREIENVRGQFDKLLVLRDWVFRRMQSQPKPGNLFARPYIDENFDPFMNLESGAAGCEWWCPHFSQMLRAVLTACGFLSRHVGNVSHFVPSEGSHTHGVTDVFVQEWGKWVMLDAHFNLHYERDGVPLSPWEVGEEAFRNDGRDIEVFTGLERKKVPKCLPTYDGKHESWRALWNHHRWNIDPFTDHGPWYGKTTSQMTLVLVGQRHAGLICQRGREPGAEIDTGYAEGRIQYTLRPEDIYPDVGTVHLSIGKGDMPGTVKIDAGTFTPNFDSLLVSSDDRPPGPSAPSFRWYLHEGENTLRVRTRDKFGNLGRESSVRAVLKKKA